jgi:transcriptional regulator with XRE-family HTH domain
VTFGEQVDAWRRAAGISGNELERRIDRSRGYFSRVVDGTILPSEETCLALGRVFEEAGIGVTAAEVIAAAIPEAAGPWVRDWYEARIRACENGAHLAELEAENVRLRAALERVRRALDEPSPPAE